MDAALDTVRVGLYHILVAHIVGSVGWEGPGPLSGQQCLHVLLIPPCDEHLKFLSGVHLPGIVRGEDSGLGRYVPPGDAAPRPLPQKFQDPEQILLLSHVCGSQKLQGC